MVQVMPDDELSVVELMLNRFRRLTADVERGTLTCNDFQPWERGRSCSMPWEHPIRLQKFF